MKGYTSGNLNGVINNGYYDIFLVKFDSNRNLLWTRLIGKLGDDDGFSNAVDQN